MRRKLLASFAVGIGAVLMAATPASAKVVVNEAQLPIAGTVFVPCANGGAGELVDIAAQMHLLAAITINDNNVSGDVHFNIDGTGTGEVTGSAYRYTDVATIKLKGSLQNGQLTATLPNTIHVIGQGSAPNFRERAVGHFTVNANGDVTVMFQTIDATCE